MTRNPLIHVVTPIVSEGMAQLGDVADMGAHGVNVRQSNIDDGPASIESEADEAAAAPDTVRHCLVAEKSGADAVAIDCMGDPGLAEARAVCAVPVFGPLETSLHGGAMLGRTFSIVTVVSTIIPLFERLVRDYGFDRAMTSIRVIDVPVLEIEADMSRTNALLAEQSTAAVEEDGADVVILGCTGFLGCAAAVRDALRQKGLSPPVIDPLPFTVLQAAAFVRAGLSPSSAFQGDADHRGH